MSIFRNMTVRSAGILFVLSLLSGCPVPDGNLAKPVCCAPPPVNPADVIGTWKMVSYTPTGASAIDVSSYNMSLVSDASTYTIVYPLAIPDDPLTPCTEYGTWSLAGNNFTTTPIAGSTCGNTAAFTQTLSVSGTTMSTSDADGTFVFQKQTATPVTGSALVGKWKMMALVDAGTVTPMNQISAMVTLNSSTYSISLPNCTETGTWSASGNSLSFYVDPASTCGSSPTYTEKVYWNNPLLTLNLSSSTTNDFIWQKQLDAPASPVATGTSGAVDVSWQTVSGATSYKVYRGTASGAFATKILLGSIGTTSLQDVTAVPGTPYYYQVTAVGTFGESAPSAEVSGAATVAATWTQRASNTPANLYDISYNGAMFLAVGGGLTPNFVNATDAAVVLSSTDGVAWTALAPGGLGLMRVVWNSTLSKFVAVGIGGTVTTSTDGQTWAAQTSGTTSGLWGVAWSGSLSKFVAVGDYGTIITSPDGVVWTVRTSGTSLHLRRVLWTGGQFVALGWGGTILTSTDGIAWSSRASNTTQGLFDIVGNGPLYVVVGAGGTILTSPDTVTWTARTSGITTSVWNVAWNGAKFIASGEAGTVLTSTDGINWSNQTTSTTNTLNSIGGSSSRIVLVGDGGTILTSP